MLKFAMPLVVAGCVVQLGWMLALAHDIFWEPDKFPFYPVLAAQIVFAFLAGSLMRSQWRATFAGFLIAISATLAFAICSRMTTIEQFMFDERAEWLISSICQALFGIPLLAAIALMGKFINSRAPRVAVRLIPVAVLLAILAGTQLLDGRVGIQPRSLLDIDHSRIHGSAGAARRSLL